MRNCVIRLRGKAVAKCSGSEPSFGWLCCSISSSFFLHASMAGFNSGEQKDEQMTRPEHARTKLDQNSPLKPKMHGLRESKDLISTARQPCAQNSSTLLLVRSQESAGVAIQSTDQQEVARLLYVLRTTTIVLSAMNSMAFACSRCCGRLYQHQMKLLSCAQRVHCCHLQ